MSERPGWVSDRLYPFEDRWLDAAGARVHFIDEGEGPTLLLLHGNPTWSFLWRDVVLGLRDRFRCVAPDLVGFGLSQPAPPGFGFTPDEQATVVARLVEELDLTDVTLVVQDWGGPIGMAVAGRLASRFRGFVIGNTWAWPLPGPLPKVWSFVLGGPPSWLYIRQLNGFVEGGMRLGTKTSLPAEVLDHYRRPLDDPASRRPVQVLAAAVGGSDRWLRSVDEGLAPLRDRPALITWPDQDTIFPPPVRRGWEDRFADHETVTLHGARHFIQEDAPDQIVSAVRGARSLS